MLAEGLTIHLKHWYQGVVGVPEPRFNVNIHPFNALELLRPVFLQERCHLATQMAALSIIKRYLHLFGKLQGNKDRTLLALQQHGDTFSDWQTL